MLLTRETLRIRWLVLGASWVLFSLLLWADVRQMRGYIGLLDRMDRRGVAELSTPLQLPAPTMFADAQTWTRHSLAVLETNEWRVRHTEIDNAPYGREVHWHSGLAWVIAVGGWARHLVTGEPLPRAVEQWLFWTNAVLLLALTVGFSLWTAWRLGLAAAVFVTFAIIGNSDIYLQFIPVFVDHHGLLTMANFGVVLGVVVMGAGWWVPTSDTLRPLPGSYALARGGMLFSALTGAAGMWVSAASVVPAIAIVGGAAIVATFWQGKALRAAGAVFEPGLWRRWGTIGAGGSLFFYLLEYAPHHFGLRMEVNHPFYALAWWGGGELVALLCEWRLDGGKVRARLPRLALAGLAAISPAVVIGIGGAKVFIVRDPLILQISARVAEGLSVFASIKHYGWQLMLPRLPWIFAAVVPTVVLLFRSGAVNRFALAFALLANLAFIGLGFFQVRFFANIGGPIICLILIWIIVISATWRLRARWIAVSVLLVVLWVPERVQAYRNIQRQVDARSVSRVDAVQPLYRDLAAVLRRSQPEGDIVLLTNPNASTAIGYYGRLKTIGTLYWENLAGVKAAAEITAATSDIEARALCRARGVTHIAMISEFAFVEEYYEMMHPDARPDDFRASLGYRLYSRQSVPLWLEEIPYEPPTDALFPDLRIAIYRTRFAPPEAEEAFARARELAIVRNLAESEKAVDRALEITGERADFWVLKAELLLARNAAAEAGRATENALRLAPASQRPDFCSGLGVQFYQHGEPIVASQLFRASLAVRFDAATAANLAWILATSVNDTLRDGATALPLAEKAVKENPRSYHYQSVLAGALAENGRYEEAVAAARQAAEIARAANDSPGLQAAEERAAAYAQRKVWRK